MGKRSQFARVERDFYPTPEAAVKPLLPHIETIIEFDEPCAGDGALIKHLDSAGKVNVYAGDIDPRGDFIFRHDALKLSRCQGDAFITNPPWRRDILHPLIKHLSGLAPTWLLFDADWPHTKQSAELMPYCAKIVSVGRLKWIPDSKYTGKDNCAWYLFLDRKGPTQFIGRAA